MPLNVLSFSRDFSMDQVLDKYDDKQNAFDILIQNGADPSLKDNDGSSLIHSAAEGGNTSIIIKLLSLGLDVDSRNNDGVTPLMTAAIVCVASVSSQGSSRKLAQEQKQMNDGGGGGERRNRLPANPTILKNCVRPRTQLLIGAVRVVLIT